MPLFGLCEIGLCEIRLCEMKTTGTVDAAKGPEWPDEQQKARPCKEAKEALTAIGALRVFTRLSTARV